MPPLPEEVDNEHRISSPLELHRFLARTIQHTASVFHPGSGQYFPEGLRVKTTSLLQAYVRVAPRSHPSVKACDDAAARMVQCLSPVRWWHVPAAVRWGCLVGLEHISEQLVAVGEADNTPVGTRLPTSRALLQSLTDAGGCSASPELRDELEAYSSRLTSIVDALTSDLLPPLDTDQMHELLSGWNTPHSPATRSVDDVQDEVEGEARSAHPLAAGFRGCGDDIVEEGVLVVQWCRSHHRVSASSVPGDVTTLDTVAFVAIVTAALVAVDYIPRRFVFLLRRELERLTDVLHGSADIVRYLQRASVAPLFSSECRVDNSLRSLIVNALGLLPEVCEASHLALEQLHAHLPPFVSVASRISDIRRSVISTAPLSHSSAVAVLRWIVGESAYAHDNGDATGAGTGITSTGATTTKTNGGSERLVRWPYTLWEVVDSCSSCTASFRGLWMQSAEAMQSVAHQRQAMRVMHDEIARLESLHQSMSQVDDDGHIDAAVRDTRLPMTSPDTGVVVDPAWEMPECVAAAEEFVAEILDKEGELVQLHEKLTAHQKTLDETEQIVSTFLRRILVAKSEIGDLRQQSHLRAVALKNARTLESAVGDVVDAIVLPVDVVQIIISETSSSDGELGQQFLHALWTLMRLMQLRQRLSADCTLPRAAIAQIAGVAEDLVILACVRIRSVVEERVAALKRPRANLAVHQEHSLGALRPFVHFVKNVVDILRRPASLVVEPGSGECARSAEAEYCHGTPRQLLYHFRVCSSIYAEMKASYVHTLREIYFVNIDRYLVQLNRLESPTTVTEGSSTSASRRVGVFAGRAVVLPECLAFPLITDLHNRVRASDFSIGKSRIRMFAGLLRHPVVPIVLQAKHQTLTYEETFRSLNVLLCDTVTREYLFSFDFFGGDAGVYVDVFQPLLQRCVDYVSEVVLCPARGSAQNLNAIALMSLIRMCHIFRAHMHAVRRLACLNTFYDSLTAQLWPAFKRAFDLQLAALRTTTPKSMCDFLLSFRSPVEKLSCIHPVTERYAELTSALSALSVTLRRMSDGDAAFASAALSRDDVDSEDHFVVLRSNLAHLRVEFTRLLSSIAPQLSSNGVLLAAALPTTPLLNNLHFVLSVWSTTAPLVVDDAQEGEAGTDPSLGFAERIAPVSPITETDDFMEVKSSLSLARAQFVEHVIAYAVPTLVAAASNEGEDSLELTAAAFAANWQQQLAQLVAVLQQTVSHSQNFRDTLSQVCMQLVLYNTRLHGLLGKSVKEGGNSLRKLIVTNHTLLSHIRTLTNDALPPNDDDQP